MNLINVTELLTQNIIKPDSAQSPTSHVGSYSQYGFSDADMQIGLSGQNEQSVDEEYRAYVRGAHAEM